MANYKPTEEDFTYFKDRVLYWAKELNLDRKGIYISFDKLEPGVMAIAQPLDETYSSFNITLNKHGFDCGSGTGDRIKHLLDATALHEVMHCTLCDIEKIAYSRYVANKVAIDTTIEDFTELITKVILRQRDNGKQN